MDGGGASRFPRYGWLGLVLAAVSWALSWGLSGLRTHVLFLPQWLGYILVADALLLRRSGSSILTKDPRGWLKLFALSVPVWWLFELFNRRLRNWEYVGGESLSDLEYFLFASASFSTVVPAVMTTAELMRSSAWIERFARGPKLPPLRPRALFIAGILMLAALLLWPRHCYPLVWISLVFLLEPLCIWRGARSLSSDLSRGDWRTWIALWSGVLVCGFFWEMWNFYAYPKWIYHIPFVGFGKVFEMPILGYLGYLPFALELYLMCQLAFRRPPMLRL